MAKHISNMDQLQKALQPIMTGMIDELAKRACVFIDYNSMDDYVSATGYQVAIWANTGLHGGLSVNHKPRVWDSTMDETINNGSLLQLAVQYLHSQGISVKS
ncbi:hypothetical protein C805_01203 [Eubacterium sp. 14-2]|uniref:hypothetical protein n=1 Tax=Eubacterium sp. 14-2 TaxID=1235790 RepID=UPI00033A11FE|nr:hypothetical protein [Eubacterium sp. 14-2]EOT27096.1 hypothetical protein C805_01203 [Eubacterium sp. 14-2]